MLYHKVKREKMENRKRLTSIILRSAPNTKKYRILSGKMEMLSH